MARGPRWGTSRREALAVLAGLLLTVTCVTACPAQTSYGFLVIGPDAAVEFGLSDGDTLQEHRREIVPLPVLRAAQAAATNLHFDPECSRYFSRDGTFVTLLRVRCDPGERFEDGESLAAFLPTGQPVGSLIPSLTPGDYTALEPGTRERHR